MVFEYVVVLNVVTYSAPKSWLLYWKIRTTDILCFLSAMNDKERTFKLPSSLHSPIESSLQDLVKRDIAISPVTNYVIHGVYPITPV